MTAPSLTTTAVAVAVVAVAFAAGRYTAPKPEIEVHTEYVTKVVTVTKTVHAKAVDRVVTKYRTVVKEVGGKETTTESERAETHERETVKTDSNNNTEGTGTAIVVIRRTESQWRVGLMGGVTVLGPNAFSYGAYAERRLLGPVWIGAWGLSSGYAGAKLGLEF